MLFGGCRLRCVRLTTHTALATVYDPNRRAFLLHKPLVVKRCPAIFRVYPMVITSSTASAHSLSAELQSLCEAIKAFANIKPSVTGSERLLKRAQRDCLFVDSLLAGKCIDGAPPQDAPNASLSQDLQGVRNNLRGLQAELDLAQQAEAVVCLGAKFYSNVSAGNRGANKKGNAQKVLVNHFVPSGKSVEVDVVAQQGLAWIEVKAHEPFDLYSSQWLGNPGHYKGLQQQVEEQLRVAQAPCNIIQWRSPAVVIHFPQGAHPAVHAELNAMGVVVTGPGRFDPALLPPMPPAPTTVNLDVTTLCAMVSEVSNGDPTRPELQQWAERVVHWQDSLKAEQQEPMLPKLHAILENKTRILSMSAIMQFEKLLQQFGGHKERQRWHALQKTVTIFHPDVTTQLHSAVTPLQDRNAQPSDSLVRQTCAFAYSAGRVAQLQAIADAQKQVFALGDDQHAVTLTANGKASEFAARQGVRLEIIIHRAVWLTGM